MSIVLRFSAAALLVCAACAEDETHFTAVDPPATTYQPPRVANAEATIAAMRPGFRTCYNKGLPVTFVRQDQLLDAGSRE